MRPRLPLLFLLSATLLPAQAPTAPPAAPRLAGHPYMGWSSWSFYLDHVTESAVLAQAKALVDAGLPALGYRYINLDDGWSDGWDDHGIPKPNLTKFPSGMDGMARQIHAQGLLFGIYLNPGIREELYNANPLIPGTAAHIKDIADIAHTGSTRDPKRANPRIHAFRIDFSKPAAAAYIQAQVAQFDRWGVDFIKFDFVGPGGGDVPADTRQELRQWHRAIAHAHRPIWLELSNFMSIDQAATWRASSNGWRIENDIECYGCKTTPATPDSPALRNLTQWSKVVERFTDVRPWIQFAGPGGWNDLDSLELGNGDRDGITPAERQSMFTLWAISCAPLYLGSDLTHLDPADLALISNRRIIAIDQAGIPASPVDIPSWRSRKGQQLWLTRYPDGSVVLAIFNLNDQPAAIQLSLEELDSLRDTHLAASSIFEDQLDGAPGHPTNGNLEFPLDPHASRLLRFTPPR